jgi:hypothetical protein
MELIGLRAQRDRLKNEVRVLLNQRSDLCHRGPDHRADHDQDRGFDTQLGAGRTEAKPDCRSDGGADGDEPMDVIHALRSCSRGERALDEGLLVGIRVW